MSDAIFDVHTHPLLPTYVQALTGESGSADGVTLPPWSAEQHIEVMDQHGIDVGILSQPALAEHLVGSEGQAIARQINEELAALVAQYPSRFGAFAVVLMDDMDAAIEEMTYALDVLKLEGLGVSTHRGGKYLGEPEYDPWFDEMNRRGVTLFVHPVAPDYFDVETSRINVSVLEFMFDSTRMVTNLVLSGTKQRFDQINIISTHGGGTLPYLAHQISIADPNVLGVSRQCQANRIISASDYRSDSRVELDEHQPGQWRSHQPLGHSRQWQGASLCDSSASQWSSRTCGYRAAGKGCHQYLDKRGD